MLADHGTDTVKMHEIHFSPESNASESLRVGGDSHFLKSTGSNEEPAIANVFPKDQKASMPVVSIETRTHRDEV